MFGTLAQPVLCNLRVLRMLWPVMFRIDRNDLSVELDFVALHYLLDCFTDVIYPGIDASFLNVY